MQQLCHLEQAVGLDTACPEERCGLWADGCAVAGMKPDFATNATLARYLLALRRRIEATAPSPPLGVHALLPPGLR